MRRFARASSVEELLGKARGRRPSVLDEFKPYLHQRWNAGCTNMLQLHAEIKATGYPGSYSIVRNYLQPFRALGAAPARHVASWILRDPATLDEDEQVKLKNVRARCPHLDALAGHVTEFAKILTGRHGDRLDAWIATAEVDDQPDLRSFTTGLRQEPRRRAQRPNPAPQFRRGRGQRQPDQDDQTPDVWPRQLRPAPLASHPGRLTRDRIDPRNV
ncbi:MAG TPA: hypothetical protein VEG33_15400, partial [Streptosporangiaceae bacterium]|nr:hypothetical protein [Streptosporangiaceae bacterium]